MNRHNPLRIGAALVGLLTLSGIALAQQGHAGHGAPAAVSDSVATKAFKAANMKMHKDMAITFSGDTDVDFVRGMLPHHQGAVDMAKIMLANGKDPELKALASSIIADQEKEIAVMQAWLKKNGK